MEIQEREFCQAGGSIQLWPYCLHQDFGNVSSDFCLWSEVSVWYERYLQVGYGALETLCTLMWPGPPSACERASSITHTNRGRGQSCVAAPNTASTASIGDPVIAVAAAASTQAEIDHHQLCLCYCDLLDMELVRMKCCKQTIHQQCVLAYLGINSQCAYCRGGIIDIAGVLALPTNNRLEIISTKMSPTQHTPTVKRDLQLLLLDMTPLQLADLLQAESQGKSMRANVSRPKRWFKRRARTSQIKEQLLVLWLLFSVITARSAILSELLVLFRRWASSAVQGLLRLLEFYCLVLGRDHGGSQRISMLWGTVQTRKPTLLQNWCRYVMHYLRGPTTSITVHQNARFKRCTNKSHKPLVHAGNLNVGVIGELVKQGIVAASRKASSVPVRALATEIVWQIQTTVNKLSLLRITLILAMNTR